MALSQSLVRAVNAALGRVGLRLARAAQTAGVVGGAPELPLPAGHGRDEILASLFSVALHRPPPNELRAYAEEDCDRFLYTLGLVPEGKRLDTLEIGSNPYFTTVLLKQFRDVALTLTNYTDGEVETRSEPLAFRDLTGAQHAEHVSYINVNVEEQRLPLADASFDLVLFCEVLEHMTNDPLAALTELSRVLRPGGHLILTTPNVARLENVARLAGGLNVYDPYSGYGPYGRHNREYTVDELSRLMTSLGFVAEEVFTADVHPRRELEYLPAGWSDGLDPGRSMALGQYIFSRWRKERPAGVTRPAWLYRSYPAEDGVGAG